MTTNSGFDDEDSFERGFSTVDSFTSPQHQHDANDLEGLNFAAPPPTQPVTTETTKKVAPDYSHIDYNSFHIGNSETDFASSTMIPSVANQMPKKPFANPNVPSSSLESDFFQSAAASAFKQFGSPSPSKAPFVVSQPKKSLIAMSSDVVSPPQISNQMVMGNPYGGSFEKVRILCSLCIYERFVYCMSCIHLGFWSEIL